MRTLIITLLTFVPGLALAQPAPAPLTADDAVALAVRQNPRLSAAARDIAAAEAGVSAARARTNPNILFTPAITPGGSDEELLVQQPLELNGTRGARTGVARAELRQTRAEAAVELRFLVFQTKNAYYELARAQELRAVAQEVLRTAQEFDRITRRMVEVGTRPGIDQVQTGIEVTRAQQQVTLAEAQVTAALAALNTLMGRTPAEPVAALAPLAFTPAPHDPAAAAQAALASRAEIEAEQARGDQFRQQARLARAEGRPDLIPQFRAGGITRGIEDAGVGVGISLPLLDYGSRRARVRQAEAGARAQEARVTATQQQVRQEVEQALARLAAAETVIRSYQLGVLDQARRLLAASQTGFQAGQTSIVQYLEAQRTYRSVLSEYTNALADYAQAHAELERVTAAVPATLIPAATPTMRNPR